MQPFVDIRVVPTYGHFQARVIWKVTTGFEVGEYRLSKSEDGINGWKQINAAHDAEELLDNDLITTGKFEEYYYQVHLIHDGKTYPSPIVSTFGQLNRREFGAARYIIGLEFKDLRQRTPVLIFKLKISAGPCPRCNDEEAGGPIGQTLCETCFSTNLDGGYWQPGLASYMRIKEISPRVQVDSPEGAGAVDPIAIKARLPAFPALRKEDVIVDPVADRRYLVETSEVGYFNGKAPVTADVSLVLLRRNDVRYKLPV